MHSIDATRAALNAQTHTTRRTYRAAAAAHLHGITWPALCSQTTPEERDAARLECDKRGSGLNSATTAHIAACIATTREHSERARVKRALSSFGLGFVAPAWR